VPSRTSTRDLLDRYDGVLLDIYGVMLDASGALPGAHAFIAELERREKPYAFVSNDASRSQATYVEKFAALGFSIEPGRVITSGSLLPGYISAKNLAGARICVLGTSDSMDFVRQGGAEVVPLARGMDVDGIAVCDDAGFSFLDGMEWSLSALVRAVDAGRRPALILPNPDLIYPKGGGDLGFTAGAMALLLVAGLARRFPNQRLAFDHLGKPQPHLFREGARRLGIAVDRLVMIGDQLETDIAGAAAAGCASALLAGSISRWDDELTIDEHRTASPTWLLDAL